MAAHIATFACGEVAGQEQGVTNYGSRGVTSAIRRRTARGSYILQGQAYPHFPFFFLCIVSGMQRRVRLQSFVVCTMAIRLLLILSLPFASLEAHLPQVAVVGSRCRLPVWHDFTQKAHPQLEHYTMQNQNNDICIACYMEPQPIQRCNCCPSHLVRPPV